MNNDDRGIIIFFSIIIMLGFGGLVYKVYQTHIDYSKGSEILRVTEVSAGKNHQPLSPNPNTAVRSPTIAFKATKMHSNATNPTPNPNINTPISVNILLRVNQKY